ncbi:MAG: tyrosine-protein phosphatase [Paracoccaceae bacterium]
MPRKPLTQAEIDAFMARRQRRLERWRRPLETRWDRVRAWTNMLLVDHGVIRLAYLNLHPVGARAWRSAQPMPHQIRAFARRGGQSVVSLRGGQTFGSLPLELEACARERLKYHNFVLRSRSLPDRETIREMAALFERLDYPVLFHCKSGADRAGFICAVYLMLAEGRPVAEARRQLSLRYGHVRQGKTGVLDAFFDAYEADTGGQVPLLDWVETAYDPERITRDFRASGWGVLVSDTLLRRE